MRHDAQTNPASCALDFKYSLIKEHTSCQISRKLAVSINKLQAIMKQQPNTIAKRRNVTIRTS